MKSKKMLVLAVMLVAILCLGLLAGCGHTHEWVEADCTNPKSCASCDATEGEALGHQLSEATYQSPALCSVCGAAEGEALTPDFVTHGIETDINAVGDSADYITTNGSGTKIVGKATLVSYDICQSFRGIEAQEGYECRAAVFDVEFGSDALTSGVAAVFYVTDYFNTALFAENPDHSNPVYSVTHVNIDGENVPVYVSQSGSYEQNGNKLNFEYAVCIQVPVGYDGIVCGLVNDSVCGSMDNIAEHYNAEDFVLFRMGN